MSLIGRYLNLFIFKAIVCVSSFQDFLDEDSLAHYTAYPGAERTVYDFTGERGSTYTVGIVGSIFNLTWSCLGAGVLVIHVGYMRGGHWTCLAASLVVGAIVSHCMMMLVTSAQAMYVRLRVPALSYSQLAEFSASKGPCQSIKKFAHLFRYIVDFSMFIKMCGILCIYEIIIAVTLKQAVENVSSTAQKLNLSERIYLLIMSVPLVASCLIRELKILAPISILALLFIAICVITTICYSFAPHNFSTLHGWNSVQGLCGFMGIYLFSISGPDNTLSIENHMAKPKYFNIVLQYTMTIVILSVTAIGILGYLSWRDNCRGPFTIHMTQNNVTVVFQFILAIVFCTTFAAQFRAPFRILWHYVGKNRLRKRDEWERFYRIIQFASITGVCIAFPNMEKLLMFFGNFFAAHITFVYPSIIETLVTWDQPYIRWRAVKHVFLIMLGFLFNIAAFYAVMY